MPDWLELEPLIAPAWAAAVVGLLAAAVVVIAWRRPPRTSPRRRRLLAVLRLAVVAAVGLMLLQPAIRWHGRTRVSTSAAVFLDSSRSMGIADAGSDSPITRAEAVRRTVATAGKAYDDFNARCIVLPLAFGSSVRPMGSFAPEATDPRTDIAEALAWAIDKSAREETSADRTTPLRSRLGAVILVSDGAANRAAASAEDAARRLAARGIKVHTVLVGSDAPAGPVRDVGVRDLRAPARVFLGYRAEVRAVVTALGMNGREVRYALLINDEAVERGSFTPASDNETREVVLTVPMTRQGLARLAVVADPVPGELVATNNRAESAVRVAEGAIRVLYLEGGIRPEGKYLARALGESAEIILDRRILVVAQPPSAGQSGGPRSVVAADGGPRSVVAANNGDATERVPPANTAEGGGATSGAGAPSPDDVEKFDLVVLGDLAASALDPAVTARIADRVAAGRLNLLALGGPHAFGVGGWDETPLAKVLPVAIRDGDGLVPGPFVMQPVPGAANHFIFAGEGSAPMNFAALPPLDEASAVGPLDPSAKLLAQSSDSRPLLVVRQFGAARVAAFMADTTYLWVLAPAETGGADVHRRFWRQLALWAAGRDGRPQTDFWVAADRPHYVLADRDNPPVAEITVHAAGPATLELKGPAGQPVPIVLAAHDGDDRRAQIALSAPGLYRLTATLGDRTERAEFLVTEQDFESAHVLADAEAMERLAQAGGGTFRRIGDLPALMADLARTVEPQYRPTDRRLPLGRGRVFLAAVILLLTVEWLLRRKWSSL